MSKLDSLREKGKSESLRDIVFVVGNNEFPAHRAVVTAMSPMLYKMYTGQSRITIKEVLPFVWKRIFDVI